MAYVNFGRKNTREEALASENKDKVFFPTDSTSIILGGKEYGVGDVKEEDLFEDSISEEYVDLGLPSGTLWATCNVGAEIPEEQGKYFAFGEVSEMEYYSYNTAISPNNTYCNNDSELTELALEDDAAYVNLGSDWRIPTSEQLEELLTICDWLYVSNDHGNTLFKVIGPNENFIILPVPKQLGDGSYYEPVLADKIYRSRNIVNISEGYADQIPMHRPMGIVFKPSNIENTWVIGKPLETNDLNYNYGRPVRPIFVGTPSKKIKPELLSKDYVKVINLKDYVNGELISRGSIFECPDLDEDYISSVPSSHNNTIFLDKNEKYYRIDCFFHGFMYTSLSDYHFGITYTICEIVKGGYILKAIISPLAGIFLPTMLIGNEETIEEFEGYTAKELIQIILDAVDPSVSIMEKVSETYATKSELNALDLSIFKMVSELPTDNIDENKIYLVPSTETEEGNIYTEYTYKNNAWEKLGEYKSDVDVTSYYWADQKISASSNAATTPTVKSLRSQYLLANDSLWISKNPTGNAANTVLNNLYFKVNNVAPGSIDSANNLGTTSYPWKTLNAIEATIGRANGAYGQSVITKGILKLQNTNSSYTSISSSATETTNIDLAHFNDVYVKEATLDGYYPLTMVESSGGLPKYESLFTKTNIKYNPVQNILDTGRVHAHTYTYSEHPENASLVVYNSLDSGNQDSIYTSMRPRIGFIYHDNHVDDRYCGQIVMDKAGFTLYRGASDNSKNTDGTWKGTNDSTYVASNGGTPYAALRCGEIKTFVDGEWKDVSITSISSEQISTLTF